jgi:hypothetical protein
MVIVQIDLSVVHEDIMVILMRFDGVLIGWVRSGRITVADVKLYNIDRMFPRLRIDL